VVLERLLSRRGAIVSREELSWAVTARPALPESRGIDSIVSRLRRKLRCRNDCAAGAIRAVRSRGYRLE
jgi:DNA-binding response OmpR family regulator